MTSAAGRCRPGLASSELVSPKIGGNTGSRSRWQAYADGDLGLAPLVRSPRCKSIDPQHDRERASSWARRADELSGKVLQSRRVQQLRWNRFSYGSSVTVA
jgi:hypothetical protein